ncbi:MAG TPA: translation elongation factor 4 [Bacilli bacterium]|jgi:GTP-binding protein LepA|nr:translation elongation factor 4 [Bacilli bacterium]
MDKQALLDKQKRIRNFSIIAHIDHGKSTLADRILELTGAIDKQTLKEQVLDKMDLEKERGITIKLNAIEINYKSESGEEYILNLIDTPGHVDFTYEVSRSLAACEGAILVIDATQGIQAQTMAHLYLALDNNLEIIPVINKIDLPNANPEKVLKEIEEVIGIDSNDAIAVSAKTGAGVNAIIEKIVRTIPAPAGDFSAPLQALIFDSYYDQYRGVVPLVRIVNGTVKKGDVIHMMSTGAEYEVLEVGVYRPLATKRDHLIAGEVGYLVASIKDVKDIRVGDTITHAGRKADKPLPGYRKLTPMVYCGFFPMDTTRYEELKEALEKISLNDASLVYEPENSHALGFGFRIGFLGLLHMDIISERIRREFGIDLIATAPSVIYKVKLTNGEVIEVDNPAKMPEAIMIQEIEEPFVKTTVMLPSEYVGPVMQICQNKRAIFHNMSYIDPTRVSLVYDMPLAEIIIDFFDRLKSSTKGYASFDYHFSQYRPSKLVRLDILLNGEKVDALSVIVHKDDAYRRGRAIVEKLKEQIPRHLFEIPIQAAIGARIIARSTIKALRKNVLAKCYGGDVSRKKKLLEKQKEGKKRMRAIGNVEIPQSAFLAVLSIDE